MKRIALGLVTWGFTLGVVAATLWFGYFGLYRLVGQVAGPSLGLAVFAGPICALLATGVALCVFVVGGHIWTRLDDRFCIGTDGASKQAQ